MNDHWDFFYCFMRGSCHFDRQLNVEIGVESWTFAFFLVFSCSKLNLNEVQFTNKVCLNSKKIAWKGPIILNLKDNTLELVSKELNHFGVIAGLFWQIGGHSSRFMLFCSFWRLFTIKMIKSVKVFLFSFWKIMTIFFYFIKFKPPA